VLRRVSTVQAYLDSLPLQLRAAVQDSVAGELRDCGIVLGSRMGKHLPQLRPRQPQQQPPAPLARAAAAAADHAEREAASLRARKRNLFVPFGLVAASVVAIGVNAPAPDSITPVYVKVVIEGGCAVVHLLQRSVTYKFKRV
jgi:hypothetical protein